MIILDKYPKFVNSRLSPPLNSIYEFFRILCSRFFTLFLIFSGTASVSHQRGPFAFSSAPRIIDRTVFSKACNTAYKRAISNASFLRSMLKRSSESASRCASDWVMSAPILIPAFLKTLLSDSKSRPLNIKSLNALLNDMFFQGFENSVVYFKIFFCRKMNLNILCHTGYGVLCLTPISHVAQ